MKSTGVLNVQKGMETFMTLLITGYENSTCAESPSTMRVSAVFLGQLMPQAPFYMAAFAG
jgi:hypothetical protein